MGKFTLKALLANKDSFKPIRFKEGLNIITAYHKDRESIKEKNTYNGVGKSLIIRIIHFCLGASASSYESFISALPDWKFTLIAELNNQELVIQRSNENPKKIILNDEEMSINTFNKLMGNLLFNIPDIQYLSFRNLLPFFIRKDDRRDYTYFDKPTDYKNEYTKIVNNAYLLGLNIYLVNKKYKLKKELDEIKKMIKEIEKNPAIKQIFSSKEKDITLTIEELDVKIDKLNKDLEQYEIAKDYEDVQKEADDIANKINILQNKKFILQTKIEKFKKSLTNLEIKDIDKNYLIKMYEEIEIYFNDKLKKRLDDLEKFYIDMIINRKQVIIAQLKKLEKDLKITNEELELLQQKLNKKNKYLGEHKAFDMILEIKDEIEKLKQQRENLTKYNKLLNAYREKKLQKEEEIAKLNKEINEYLEKVKNNFKTKSSFFRSIAKKLYPTATSGLTLQINEGENQIAFNINAKIDSDSSNGINKAKIFCYDNTILFKGENHKVGFVFHDSVLFDGIDEIQVAEMFRFLINNYTSHQYITALNQNQIDMLKNNLTREEFKHIIENNIILTLTDKSDEEKLLGIKVEIEF